MRKGYQWLGHQGISDQPQDAHMFPLIWVHVFRRTQHPLLGLDFQKSPACRVPGELLKICPEVSCWERWVPMKICLLVRCLKWAFLQKPDPWTVYVGLGFSKVFSVGPALEVSDSEIPIDFNGGRVRQIFKSPTCWVSAKKIGWPRFFFPLHWCKYGVAPLKPMELPWCQTRVSEWRIYKNIHMSQVFLYSVSFALLW